MTTRYSNSNTAELDEQVTDDPLRAHLPRLRDQRASGDLDSEQMIIYLNIDLTIKSSGTISGGSWRVHLFVPSRDHGLQNDR